MNTKHPADVLADEIAGMVCTYPQTSEDEPGGYESPDDMTLDNAAAMLRTIPALEKERDEYKRQNDLRIDLIKTGNEMVRQLQEELAALKAQRPVSAQCRFHGIAWAQCDVEHALAVLAAPHEWPRYEVRMLYAAPQAAQAQKPIPADMAKAISAGLFDMYEPSAHGIKD